MRNVSSELEWNGKEVIQDFDKALNLSLLESVRIVHADAVTGINSDMNQLRSSLFTTVKNKVGEVGTNAEYAAAYEFGSRPHWAPKKAIVDWAGRRGLSKEIGQRIWISIAKKGTKAHPFLHPAFLKNVNRIIAIFKKRGIAIKWVQK